MKKWVSSTDIESVKAEKKEIEVVKVVQVINPEQTPKPQIVVKKVINKKKVKNEKRNLEKICKCFGKS